MKYMLTMAWNWKAQINTKKTYGATQSVMVDQNLFSKWGNLSFSEFFSITNSPAWSSSVTVTLSNVSLIPYAGAEFI